MDDSRKPVDAAKEVSLATNRKGFRLQPSKVTWVSKKMGKNSDLQVDIIQENPLIVKEVELQDVESRPAETLPAKTLVAQTLVAGFKPLCVLETIDEAENEVVDDVEDDNVETVCIEDLTFGLYSLEYPNPAIAPQPLEEV
ncbi:OLC1v1031140C1 [Oldenlandia corymbosa var. corymbosa]|uniref:OLC1v1031140C1 n=1 Tax=Oldenlandia corymbosa var. corymbosa TaxID=529605 RepID=A0AAV1CIH6_OLDCO|nr:OLC1v1031140C1 [Oldenlandia corymbosa var. corymbosa]